MTADEKIKKIECASNKLVAELKRDNKFDLAQQFEYHFANMPDSSKLRLYEILSGD